jgi:hypothetical protein
MQEARPRTSSAASSRALVDRAASPNPLDHTRGLLEVDLGVVLLRDAGGRVPEHGSRRLEARDLADLRGRRVSNLVWRPAVLEVPLPQFVPLGGGEPVRTARPQTQTAPRSEAESVAGLGDQLRGGASKRVKGLELRAKRGVRRSGGGEAAALRRQLAEQLDPTRKGREGKPSAALKQAGEGFGLELRAKRGVRRPGGGEAAALRRQLAEQLDRHAKGPRRRSLQRP